MKWIVFCLVVTLMGCVNEKKVAKWNDNHLDKSAKYCATKFPFTPIIDTIFMDVDSSAYFDAYAQAIKINDSLIDLLMKKPDTIRIIDSIKIDSVRIVFRNKLKSALKPCVDSTKTIIIKQIDSARLFVLNHQIDSLSESNSILKQSIEKKDSKISDQSMTIIKLWVAIVLLFIILTRHLWLKMVSHYF